jgi:hypothetical protein
VRESSTTTVGLSSITFFKMRSAQNALHFPVSSVLLIKSPGNVAISMTFELLDRTEKNFGAGLFALYKFKVLDCEQTGSMVDEFLKQSGQKITVASGLGPPFNNNLLRQTDFKYFTKASLISFFDEFSQPAGWTDNTFIKNQLSYLKDTYSRSGAKEFFLITPNFFDINFYEEINPKFNLVADVYLWYYLILTVDKANHLTVCQMYMD